MNFYVLIPLIVLDIFIVTSAAGFEEVKKDVCQYETLTAQCNRGEVIVITKALYGHLGASRCIDMPRDGVDCKDDVMSIVSNRCDGRDECVMEHDDDEIRVLQPCGRGIYMYLEVSYVCIQAKPVKPCQPVTIGNDKVFISRKLSQEQSCTAPGGAGRSQVLLTTTNGRHIEISGIGFSDEQTDSNQVEVGYLLDEGTQQITSLRLGHTGSERVMIVSESNRAMISMNLDVPVNFLILFRAVGCEDMKEPRDMWLNRDGDQLTVGCHNSRKTWSLKCEGVHWRGVIGNCTKDTVVAIAEVQFVEEITMALPRDVVLMIIFSTTALLALIIVTSGYVTYKRSSLSLCPIPMDSNLRQHNILKNNSDSQNQDGVVSAAPSGPGYTLMRLQENPTQPQPPPVPPRKDNLSAQTTLLMKET